MKRWIGLLAMAWGMTSPGLAQSARVASPAVLSVPLSIDSIDDNNLGLVFRSAEHCNLWFFVPTLWRPNVERVMIESYPRGVVAETAEVRLFIEYSPDFEVIDPNRVKSVIFDQIGREVASERSMMEQHLLSSDSGMFEGRCTVESASSLRVVVVVPGQLRSALLSPDRYPEIEEEWVDQTVQHVAIRVHSREELMAFVESVERDGFPLPEIAEYSAPAIQRAMDVSFHFSAQSVGRFTRRYRNQRVARRSCWRFLFFSGCRTHYENRRVPTLAFESLTGHTGSRLVMQSYEGASEGEQMGAVAELFHHFLTSDALADATRVHEEARNGVGTPGTVTRQMEYHVSYRHYIRRPLRLGSVLWSSQGISRSHFLDAVRFLESEQGELNHEYE